MRSTGKRRGLATDVSQREAYLLLFRLFIFLAFSLVIVPKLYLLVSFALSFYKLTQENSRKQRGLATNVSQGQTSRNRRLARTSVPTSYLRSMLVHLPSLWLGYCTSFCCLTCLSTSHLKKCLASTDLASRVSQQTSCNGCLARTGMPTSLGSSYLSSVLVHLRSLWFGYCTSFCP